METGNDKPKGKAINGSIPVSSSSLISDTKCRCHKHDEDGAKNSRMSSIPDSINLDKPGESHLLYPIMPLSFLMKIGVELELRAQDSLQSVLFTLHTGHCKQS